MPHKIQNISSCDYLQWLHTCRKEMEEERKKSKLSFSEWVHQKKNTLPKNIPIFHSSHPLPISLSKKEH